MIEKMTLEQFEQIKNQLANLVKQFEEYDELHKNDENYNGDEIQEKFTEQYLSIQNHLLSYDLSDIPFEAWKDFEIFSDETHIADFSKTRANIDFDLIAYFGDGNFRGCNVRNLEKLGRRLNWRDFDEGTIKANSSIFLSDIFSEAFKDKYYSGFLTIKDLASLSDQQLDEIKHKDFKLHMGYEEYDDKELLLKTLGFDRVVELYKYSLEEYDAVNKLIAMCYDPYLASEKGKEAPSVEEFLERIKTVEISELKNTCFDFARKQIINSTGPIKVDDYPEMFIKENPDIFLVGVDIPDEVKERYFHRQLQIQDLIDYPDAFEKIPVDYFIASETDVPKFIRDNYGMGKFQELLQKHSDVFAHIAQEKDFYFFQQFLKKGKDLDRAFSDAVKNYFVNYGMPAQFRVVRDGQTIYNVPDWLSSMNFKFVDKLNTPEDLLAYTDSVFVLDPDQRRTLETLNIDNIKRFEQETGFFTYKGSSWWSEDLKMFKAFSMFFNIYSTNSLANMGIDFKNGSLSYEEFENQLAKCFDIMRKDEFFLINFTNYDWIQGEFRNKHPEIFIDQNAPEELKSAYYRGKINVGFLFDHQEYIPYLIDKNLSNVINGNIKLLIPSLIDEKGNIIPTSINFIDEYVSRYGNEKLLKLISKYGVVLSGITISSINNEIEDEQAIEKSLRSAIYSKITRGKRDYSYLANIPEMVREYPKIFVNFDELTNISQAEQQRLTEAFYSRSLTFADIKEYPELITILKDKDLSIPFDSDKGNNRLLKIIGNENFLQLCGIYGKYMDRIVPHLDDETIFGDIFQNFQSNSKDTLLDAIDKVIFQSIINDHIMYDESIPDHFKNNYPTLFLNKNVPQEIKDKFYNRKLALEDFIDNPRLFEIFSNTNIACGFSTNMSWIIPLFDSYDSFSMANNNRWELILGCYKIQDAVLEQELKDYITEFEDTIASDKIKFVAELLSRLSLSNSSEIFAFRKELATQLLKSDDPLEDFSKIEDVFIKSNLPTVGKRYSCFEILHPDFKGFNMEHSMISPVLQRSSLTSKKIIVFSDLIKCAFGSNNMSINAYLKNIEIGSKLYEKIKAGQMDYDTFSEIEKQELLIFSKHLATLYNNTMKAQKENRVFVSSGDILTDLFELSQKLSPNGSLDYNLGDRVVRMFCGFAGIDTLETAMGYTAAKVKFADFRNRKASTSDMVLEQGDFIKGIGGITHLRSILQNGSVAKEYLGASAESDATPLDTDLSMIRSSDKTIREKIVETEANDWGPIWFVLKNDDRFVTTRTKTETLDKKRDLTKIEVFYTGAIGNSHYGIRTGFASSEINYIVMEQYDPRVGLEIAMNGFYIPVVNKEGKIIFTPKDYDELRAKMNGLSYLGEETYTFSDNLVTEEIETLAEQVEQSNYEVQLKREKINRAISQALEELGLHLKTSIDGDLTEGFVELIDTGSTGRGTNKPGDGDFDFMMRLDKSILSDPRRLAELKQTILKKLGKDNSSQMTGDGDFRLKEVQLDDDTSVDIDITFTRKTDQISYSTDMALQDRLATIYRTDPEKYKYVIANILLAKQVLKEAGVYKPNRGETPQGGLGGVGIENWILQNGGSFIDAAKSFVEAADGKSFEEFKKIYQIWDFGENHLAEKRGFYPHDNFVEKNMNETGYQNMLKALKNYLQTMDIEPTKTGKSR